MDEKPNNEKPNNEKPNNEKPNNEKPANVVTVYKIARPTSNNDVYASYCCPSFVSLDYTLGEVTDVREAIASKNSIGIFCFGKLEDAEDYATKICIPITVLECEAEVCEKQSDCSAYYYCFTEFYDALKREDERSRLCGLLFSSEEVAKGTVFCKWVKPVRIVG